MRLQLVLATALLLASFASHADTTSTVPNAYASTAGNGTFLGPLSNSARTYQLLIDSSQLTAHVGGAISGLSFRLLASATADWPTAAVSFSSYDIRLSGSVAPASRSLTFADNVVGTQTLVRSGALAIAPGSYDSGGSPNAYGLTIGFDTNYVYTGGNLLVEIRHTGFSGTSASVDSILASSPAGVGYGTLFSAAWTGSYTGVTGTQGNFSVLQLISTPVPEPAAALLFAVGALGLLAQRRRKA